MSAYVFTFAFLLLKTLSDVIRCQINCRLAIDVYNDLLYVASCVFSYLSRCPYRKDFRLEDTVVFRKLEVSPENQLRAINSDAHYISHFWSVCVDVVRFAGELNNETGWNQSISNPSLHIKKYYLSIYSYKLQVYVWHK